MRNAQLPSLVAALLSIACDAKPQAAAPAPAAAAAPAPAAAPAAAPADDKVKVVEGAPPGQDDRYAIQIDAPKDGKIGEQGKVTVRVVPKAPWHVNLDFPTSLKVAPPTGVALAKAELKKADAVKLDENTAEFAVQFTANDAGDKSFAGTFKFAVCQDEACSPVTEDVSFKVAVK